MVHLIDKRSRLQHKHPMHSIWRVTPAEETTLTRDDVADTILGWSSGTQVLERTDFGDFLHYVVLGGHHTDFFRDTRFHPSDVVVEEVDRDMLCAHPFGSRNTNTCDLPYAECNALKTQRLTEILDGQWLAGNRDHLRALA
jgi:hypothetical protein